MKTRETGGYDSKHFRDLFAAEDRHFWFTARCRLISVLAKQLVADLADGYRILEIGCGNGNVLRSLSEACTRGLVVGMDLYEEGLHYARTRTNSGLVRGDIRHSPFGEKFDLVGVFDVLEHIPDDEGVLRELRQLLTARGALMITVPAHRHLWSYFDEASGHCRRYHPNELMSKLTEAGFRIEYMSQYMAALHPFMWLSRSIRGWRSSGDSAKAVQREVQVIPVVNEVFGWLLSLEAAWIARHGRLPMGTSLIAIARRADDAEPHNGQAAGLRHQ